MAVANTAELGFTPAYIAARSGETQPRATPADAFAAAREIYLSGERLDMRELAAKLGVARTTLYRWCGDREQLLADVVWSVTEELIGGFEAATLELRGRERLRQGVRLFMQFSAQEPALRALLKNETHAAMRLMSGIHSARLVAELARLINEENEREDMQLRASPELVAFTIVRVMEGFIYNEAIAAVEPRLEEAMEVLDFLLA